MTKIEGLANQCNKWVTGHAYRSYRCPGSLIGLDKVSISWKKQVSNADAGSAIRSAETEKFSPIGLCPSCSCGTPRTFRPVDLQCVSWQCEWDMNGVQSWTANIPVVQYTTPAILASLRMVSRNSATPFDAPIWPIMNFTSAG